MRLMLLMLLLMLLMMMLLMLVNFQFSGRGGHKRHTNADTSTTSRRRQSVSRGGTFVSGIIVSDGGDGSRAVLTGVLDERLSVPEAVRVVLPPFEREGGRDDPDQSDGLVVALGHSRMRGNPFAVSSCLQ